MPYVERLFAAQSSLELRISRSLSLGRWLWRGVNFSEMHSAATAAAAIAAAATREDDGQGAGKNGGGGGGINSGAALAPPVGGIWVPWETEAANASPECLKVSHSNDAQN